MADEVTAELLQSWVSGLDGLFARVAGRFGRWEPRRQARGYVMGLLAPVERKNGWQLAEAAGDSCPDRMQRLGESVRLFVYGEFPQPVGTPFIPAGPSCNPVGM